MKKLLTIISIGILLSCSTDSIEEESCRCEKETYRFEQTAVTGANGLPVIISSKVILSNEVIPCQAEQDQVNNGDGTYFDINCE